MRIIVTEKAKKKVKENPYFERSYWELLYPSDYAEDMTSEESNDVKTASRKVSVPLKGVVKQTKDGFVYVNVSNDVIHGLFRLIDHEGAEKPPYMTEDFNNVGAHITVIGSSELGDQEFSDVGKEITFKLGKFCSVEPEGWEEVERVWFMEVYSTELEELRKKYGLSRKKNGHEFHITIALKMKK